eukprot:2499001-Prymnesium_polylepis.3
MAEPLTTRHDRPQWARMNGYNAPALGVARAPTRRPRRPPWRQRAVCESRMSRVAWREFDT